MKKKISQKKKDSTKMNFDDFLGRHRNSEPRVVHIMRIFTLLIISSCLTAYIVTLIINVNEEQPTIIISEVPMDSLSVPGNILNINNLNLFVTIN